jgi:hypothetical protein
MSDQNNLLHAPSSDVPAQLAISDLASPDIDPTEAARLAGYNPIETEQMLEADYQRVQTQEGGDTRPKHENPLMRLATVALPIGAISGGMFGIWFLFMAPKADKQPELAASPLPPPTLTTDNEGALKS